MSRPWLTPVEAQTLTALLVLLCAATILRGAQAVESTGTASQPVAFRVNLNAAAIPELTALDGIGPVTAEHILQSRHRDGPFGSVDELTRVKGIGPKTLARLRPWLTVE